MNVSNFRFGTSDTKSRKRHEVKLSVDSPNSVCREKVFTVVEVAHITPTEKAIEAKEQRARLFEKEAYPQEATFVESEPIEVVSEAQEEEVAITEQMPCVAAAPVEVIEPMEAEENVAVAPEATEAYPAQVAAEAQYIPAPLC